jgi:hypothetical protein
MSQENHIEKLAEAVQEASLSERPAGAKMGNRPQKAEKLAKQPPPPPAEDHAKDRYGKVPINFGTMTHTGMTHPRHGVV